MLLGVVKESHGGWWLVVGYCFEFRIFFCRVSPFLPHVRHSCLIRDSHEESRATSGRRWQPSDAANDLAGRSSTFLRDAVRVDRRLVFGISEPH